MFPPFVNSLFVHEEWTSNFVPLLQVFDNYAVTVMIGDEPYTLGLFDTAGMSLLAPEMLCRSPQVRSGGLRSLEAAIISPDRRFLGLLQRYVPSFVRKCQGEMVP